MKILYLWSGPSREGDLQDAADKLSRALNIEIEIEFHSTERGSDLEDDQVWHICFKRCMLI